ncbi:MAG: hypothetical protein Q4G26_14230, partial [Paracoccus sp. (in: a-proteobacteria)]|nr:hypothetical protein [Paracoccus sp. (in: a-proteobacteria)]
MAFTPEKQAMRRTGGAALALSLLAVPAVADRPVPFCDGAVESGMSVWGAWPFGYIGSGFTSESYGQRMIFMRQADGSDSLDYPPLANAALEGFDGYRIVNCQTREFLAIDGGRNEYTELLATEFLRSKAQKQQPFTLSDVRQAVEAIDAVSDRRIIPLQATEQTCACKYFN